jgi:hypothetical protein
MWVDIRISTKIAHLREFGVGDPVKMITSNPAIVGYALERLLLSGGIVTGLDKGTDEMLVRLIKEPRSHRCGRRCPATDMSKVRAIITRVKRTR